MTRREFAAGSSVLAASALAPAKVRALGASHRDIFVATNGNDQNPGTIGKPLATLARAQAMARDAGKAEVNVILRGGVYYLPQPMVFTSADSARSNGPIRYSAYATEKPVVSGGVKVDLHWKPYRDGIFMAQFPAGVKTDQLFVNGKRQISARYPNFDPAAKYFDGFAADAFSHERAARWADPTGGFIHAMHPALWGDFHYRITGKDANGDVTYEGGWQNNRPSNMHKSIRFVENIFEELDSPGEWYLNGVTDTLYYYPPAEVDLGHAVVEAVRLRNLVEFHGDARSPVRGIEFEGLTFRHATRTFMETREPILRTDWAIYRGGALFISGAVDCVIKDCEFEQLGGNAIFVSGYNRGLTIQGCEIVDAGASGICFLGDPEAVRNPLFNYSQRNELADIDRTPGPKTSDYPAECRVEDCLLHRTGRFEKQTAPIEIDMAQSITVSRCSIYDVPRAGINIGDGCWGGHVIEYCDVFDTVKETGDHGSYNSWGRDRYWLPNRKEFSEHVHEVPELPFLDVVLPITLRNNRWRCDHGWDIDLDDGSSHYEITNNLCLHGGIKNREGYGRFVHNNITVNNSFHLHVWPDASGDVYQSNIVFGPYRPIGMPPAPWGKEFDRNFMHMPGAPIGPAAALQQQSGRDAASLTGDAQFVNPAVGDYTVSGSSPVVALGFKNFPMDRFGVQSPRLRAIARQPEFGLGTPGAEDIRRDGRARIWSGVSVRNIINREEMSAYGLAGVTGVLVLAIPADSRPAKCGLQKSDVILAVNGANIVTVDDLFLPQNRLVENQPFRIRVSRLQKEIDLQSP